MPILRVVQLTLDSPERVHAAAREATTMFPTIPGVTSFKVGHDGARIVLLVGFADASHIHRYVDHPKHRTFVDHFLAPYANEKTVTNYVEL